MRESQSFNVSPTLMLRVLHSLYATTLRGQNGPLPSFSKIAGQSSEELKKLLKYNKLMQNIIRTKSSSKIPDTQERASTTGRKSETDSQQPTNFSALHNGLRSQDFANQT